MIISEKRRFIFLHNPKAAGTSFRRAIEQYHDWPRKFWGYPSDPYMGMPIDLAHLRLWELAALAPDLAARINEFQKLVFVRCPLRRFVAACFEHFIVFRPEVRFGALPPEAQRTLLLRFIAQDLTPQKIAADYRYVHFSPQRWYVTLGEQRVVDHIVPVISRRETFSKAFGILGIPPSPPEILNRRASFLFDKLICPDIIAFVRSFYALDYELFESIDSVRSALSTALQFETPVAGS